MTLDEMIVTLQRALNLSKADRYPDPEIALVINALHEIKSEPKAWYIPAIGAFELSDKNNADYKKRGFEVISLYAAPSELRSFKTVSAFGGGSGTIEFALEELVLLKNQKNYEK